MKVVASPLLGLTRSKLTTLALDAQSMQPLPDVRVNVDELIRRISGAEIVAPSAQHRVDISDDFADVIMTPCSWSQLLHALSYSLHAALRRPSLEVVHALALLLPDPAAQPLSQVTAEEVEPLLAPREIDSPRFVRVEFELKPFEDDLHPSFSFLALLRRATHHHEVVRVAHQHAQMRTLPPPDAVEIVQIDVRQKRRDHSTLRNARHGGDLPSFVHHLCPQPQIGRAS